MTREWLNRQRCRFSRADTPGRWGLASAAVLLTALAGCPTNTQEGVDPLIADAGSNLVATTGETLTLTVSATGGTAPYDFSWDIVEVPEGEEPGELPDGDQAQIRTLPFVEGRYVYRAVVTDAGQFTTAANTNVAFVVIDVIGGLSVTIQRQTDDAGDPIAPVADEPFTLTADAGGMDDLTYSWSRVSGPDVAFGDASGAETNVTAEDAGEVIIRVEVSDAAGRNVSDEITLVVLEGNRPRVTMLIESNIEGVSGEVVFELFADLAPQTVENFLSYVDAGFYDDMLWHRVSGNADGSPFVVQTGGFTRDGNVLVEKEALFDPVDGEPGNGLSNQVGTIAMALVGNDPDSGTSQFFVNLGDNSFLDDVFTVFGEVAEGMNLIDAMALVETGETDLESGGRLSEVPVDDITILNLRRLTPLPAAQGD